MTDLVSEVKTKVCGQCKNDLPVDNFSKAPGRKDGLRYNCKACVTEYNKSDIARVIQKRSREKRRKVKGPTVRPDSNFISAKEAAQLCNISRSTLSVLTTKGTLIAVRVGKNAWYKLDEIETFKATFKRVRARNPEGKATRYTAPVYMFDATGEFMKKFISISRAAIATKINRTTIHTGIKRRSIVLQRYYFSFESTFKVIVKPYSHNPLKFEFSLELH